jgi:hypothetical protein
MSERNYSFEALAEVTGTDWNAGRGELNIALKSIRAQCDISDDYLLAAEIHERAKMYRQAMPDVMLTPTALAKHWKRVFEEAERPKGTNLSAVTECQICGGDRFVTVEMRKPVQSQWMREHGITPPVSAGSEVVAPCPSCNAKANSEFRRYDGSLARPLDPAKTRELMER